MKRRLFFAVCFNDHFRQHLSEMISQLKKSGISGRFARIENLHLTLQFIGDVEDTMLPDLSDILRKTAAQTPAFELSVSALGCFGRRSEILWLGLETCEQLTNMQRLLTQALEEAKLPCEQRAFRPHITLVRQAKFKPDCLPALNRFIPAFGQTVSEIALMESLLLNGRRQYLAVEKQQLRTISN